MEICTSGRGRASEREWEREMGKDEDERGGGRLVLGCKGEGGGRTVEG